MRIIKNNQVQDDEWSLIVTVDSGDTIPDGDIIIPFKYWKENQTTLDNRVGKTAICINGEDRIEDIVSFITQFDLIALEFPAFKDGRCYSHARLLRDRYKFEGDLRAVGDVLRDQVFYLNRCGISSFYIRDDKDIEDALNALKDFTVTYQTAADGALPVYKLR